MSFRRISKELRLIIENPPENCSVVPNDGDETTWQAALIGPKDTPYEGGVFRLIIKFPDNYPFKPPKVAFRTKIFHPNIGDNGVICLDLLNQHWSPAMTISTLLDGISELLRKPVPDKAIEPEIAHLYVNDPDGFSQMAREWTRTYAMR